MSGSRTPEAALSGSQATSALPNQHVSPKALAAAQGKDQLDLADAFVALTEVVDGAEALRSLSHPLSERLSSSSGERS